MLKILARMLIIAILFVTSCVGTVANVKHSADVDGALSGLEAGCVKTDSPEKMLCERKCLANVYDAMVDCKYDLIECTTKERACREKCGLRLERCEVEKRAWYRKWYITGSIGMAIGTVLGVIALSLGR